VVCTRQSHQVVMRNPNDRAAAQVLLDQVGAEAVVTGGTAYAW